MNKKESFSPPAVGGISLLVVFAVLCLTIFGLLSLATVRADGRLADASAQAVTDYYAADCEAQAILAQLLNGEVPSDVTAEGSVYSYTCPVSKTQNLEVEVSIEESGYTVLRWQAVPVGGGEEDGGLNLWDGTHLFAE